jgi:Ca-activated chloride channel family protein
MNPFRNLEARSRRVIGYATLAYIFTVILLLVFARAALASAEPAAPPVSPSALGSETVSAAALEGGGLFLATDDPARLLPAPLQSSEVDISVSGPLARVVVRQTYSNPTDIWLEAIYTFPLPDKSAVDRLTMIIGERRIQGVIQEKEQARKTYQQAKRQGRRASLVDQERPNIFTTQLANIGPGETITIEIQYQQNLRFDAGAFSLRFPMVIRPRFNPGDPVPAGAASGSGWSWDTSEVPDASRITPHIIDPALGPINPVRINVTLDPGFPVGKISSPYHLLDISRLKDNRYAIALAAGEVPADRDFVLNWRPAPGTMPSAGIFTELRDGQAYHLLMIMPPARESLQGEPAGSAHARETVFILDVSGSMAGPAIHQAKAALLLALGRLGPQDSFNVIAFSSDATPLFADARPADRQNLDQARSFVRRLQANGGTNMASALRLALNGDDDFSGSGERVRQIIFITDGAVGNEEALFTMISRGLGASRLFTVGISSSPNSFFMSEAAESGRGTYTFIGSSDEVEEKMSGLFRKLERPVLKDVSIDWPAGVSAERYPSAIPDLYDGEPLVLAFRTAENPGGALKISGGTTEGDWARSLPLVANHPNPGVAAIWARAKILDITRLARRSGKQHGTETRDKIVRVALAHQLISKYTSLVAVDDRIARPEGSEIASAAVPSNLPDGADPAFATMKRSRAASAPAMAPTRRIHREALAAGSPVPLPRTATPALQQLLAGFLSLLLVPLVWVYRRRLIWRGL